jgi:hypothetical protein
MTDYYVSPNGNDTAPGTSPDNAWKTTRRVQLAGTGFGPLYAGDRILFERNGVFPGYLDVPGVRAEKSAKVHVSAYGYGDLPKITAYKTILQDAWQQHVPNIWKVAINDTTKFTGNIYTTGASGANTGFLRVDGVIKGFKRYSIAGMVADWEFYSDEAAEILYVFSEVNPGMRALEIQQAPRQTLIIPRTSLAVSLLHFQGTGGHAHGGATRDFDLEGFEISEIGGSRLSNEFGETRYGNAVQFYTEAGGIPTKRVNIRRGIIRDVYDVAFTMQGPGLTAATDGWEDVHITDNVIVRCAQSLELWNRFGNTDGAGTPPAGAGYRRCSYERNTDIDSGRGWQEATRPNYVAQASLLTFALEAPSLDVNIDNNIHINPSQLIYNHFPLPGGLKWTRSRVFGRSDTPIDFLGTERLEDLDAYIARTGVAGGTIAQCADYDAAATLENAMAVLMGSVVTGEARDALHDANLSNLGGEMRAVRSAVEALREQPVSNRLSIADMAAKIAGDGTLAYGATGGQGSLVEAFQGKWRRLTLGGVTDIVTGTNDIFQYINSASMRRYTATQIANLDVAISPTGCIPGAMFYLSRTGGDTGGPWYLRVRNSGGAVITDLYANQWCVVAASNNAPYTWVLVSKGSLA